MADLSLIPEAAWHEAERRADVICSLAERERRPRHLVRAAAATLGGFHAVTTDFKHS